MCGAWPYINSVPHLGTLIGSELSADVLARYLRLKGEDVVFVSGSDEHGTPIELEAIKSGMTPKELTDKYHALVTELFSRFCISFDNYSRTSNAVHVAFCRDFFSRLHEKGYIFVKEVELLFCQHCNIFLPDRFVQGVCPNCSYKRARGDQCENCGKVLDALELLEPRCSICDDKPVVRTTKHWFFDLPRFAERLRGWLLSSDKIPESVKRFSLRWIEEGLKPRAVTRDNRWGVPAPFSDEERKTIYVWFEAVLGYITATIEWSQRIGEPERWKSYWLDQSTKSVYFFGKDNIPFHTIILPALLMAYDEGFVLPWSVSVSEYLRFEGQKFSKSQRIGIWLDDALRHFEADYWRYYLIKIRPESGDTNFSLEEFKEVVNSELNDTIGNFVHRVLTFINRYFDGAIPEPGSLDEDDVRVLDLVKSSPRRVGELLEDFKERQALDNVVSLAREGNAYLNVKEPWRTIKDDVERAKTTMYVAAQVVACLATLLEPFIPITADRIRDMLNIERGGATDLWRLAGEGGLEPGHKIKPPRPLFTKITDERIQELRAMYYGRSDLQ